MGLDSWGITVVYSRGDKRWKEGLPLALHGARKLQGSEVYMGHLPYTSGQSARSTGILRWVKPSTCYYCHSHQLSADYLYAEARYVRCLYKGFFDTGKRESLASMFPLDHIFGQSLGHLNTEHSYDQCNPRSHIQLSQRLYTRSYSCWCIIMKIRNGKLSKEIESLNLATQEM